MARRRREVAAAPSGLTPPAALLDWDSPVWVDPDLFAAWCSEHDLSVDLRFGDSPFWRFRCAAASWAQAQETSVRDAGIAEPRGRFRFSWPPTDGLP